MRHNKNWFSMGGAPSIAFRSSKPQKPTVTSTGVHSPPAVGPDTFPARRFRVRNAALDQGLRCDHRCDRSKGCSNSAGMVHVQ